MRVRVTVDPSLPMGQRGLRRWGKWVRTRVGEEVIRVRSFADRRDEGAGPASPIVGERVVARVGASSRSERANGAGDTR